MLYLTRTPEDIKAVEKAVAEHKEINFTNGIVVEDLDIFNGRAVVNLKTVIYPFVLSLVRAKIEYAINHPDVKEIILNIDSPGGNVTDTDETAEYIKKMSTIKPITAYVAGACASGAYWIASACTSIVCTRTAEVGSIGVVFTMWKTGDYIVSVVSSQSPNKNPNPESDAGKAQYQKRADDLAAIFIMAVAENRKMTSDEVIKNGQQGGVMIAELAVKAGLADSISTLNELLNTEITEDSSIMDIKELKERHRSVYAEAAADGVQIEAKRQSGIRELSVPGCEDIIASALADTTKTVEAVALEIVQHQQSTAQAQNDAEERKRLDGKKALLTGSVQPVPGASEDPAADGQGFTVKAQKVNNACEAYLSSRKGGRK